MFRRQHCMIIATAVVLSIVSSTAQAAFMLSFSDGIVTRTVTDNNAPAGTDLDTNPAAGLIIATVAMTDYNLVVAVSTSKSPGNSPKEPAMALNLLNVSYTHTGTAPVMTVMMTDDFFVPPHYSKNDFIVNNATQNMGAGVTVASSTATGYLDPSNTPFNTVAPAIATPPVSFLAIGGSQSGTSVNPSLVGTTPYSMTGVMTITSTASYSGGAFTQNLSIANVPEPGSWLLMGLAAPAFGMGLLIRRRREKRAAK